MFDIIIYMHIQLITYKINILYGLITLSAIQNFIDYFIFYHHAVNQGILRSRNLSKWRNFNKLRYNIESRHHIRNLIFFLLLKNVKKLLNQKIFNKPRNCN